MNYDEKDLEHMEFFSEFVKLREKALEKKLKSLIADFDSEHCMPPIEDTHKVHMAIRNLLFVQRCFNEYIMHKDKGEEAYTDTPVVGISENDWNRI